MLKSALLSLLALSASVLAAPAPTGITIDKDGMPILTLPYAAYKARYYDRTDDYYTFKNIRFAKSPTGELRWKPPVAPDYEAGIKDGSEGAQCHQALPGVLSIGTPFLRALEPESEDCLFLDILVPGKVIRGEAKNLPVLNWFFGGGYAMGSKSFFLYDGHALLNIGKNNFIYVAPNYRLGAFGWLNGITVQDAPDAKANIGLYDQRAALQWIQDYIHLVGGDKNTVTVMGESAGAGSIQHHLVANGGKQNPLFHRAIIQSPAFEPLYDRNRLEAQYKAFEAGAGCAGKGLACLRAAPIEKLAEANNAVIKASPYGTFGFGPGVDNDLIQDLPFSEFHNGRYWKDVSVIVGHTDNEGFLFANPAFVSSADVEGYINNNFPNTTAAIRKKILDTYPSPSLFTPYDTQFGRTAAMIGEFVVSCNVREIAKAYQGKAWSYNFAVPPAIHGMDLLFTWWRTDLNLGNFQLDFDFGLITKNNLATTWQRYLVSFAINGDPNSDRAVIAFPLPKTWTKAVTSTYTYGLELGVLRLDNTWNKDTPKDNCDFFAGSKVWRQFAQ